MNPHKTRHCLFVVIIFLALAGSGTALQAQINPLALPTTATTAAASASDTTVTVSSTAGFPSSGEIAIGVEILSYSSVTPTTFVISGRGLASTTAAAHDAGSAVIYFPVNAGLLTQAVDNASTTITLNSTSTFPVGTGAFIIDQEVMSYSGGTTTTLTGLSRGLEGTVAAAHNAGAVIVGRVISPLFQTFGIPRLISTADNFSGFAIANTSKGPATVTLQVFNSDGTPVTVTSTIDGTTTTLAKVVTMGPGQQFTGSLTDVFGDLAGTTNIYATAATGNPLALGVTPIGNIDPAEGFNRLDLAPFSLETSTDVTLPIALQGSTQYGAAQSIEIGIVASTFASTITIDLVDATGNVLEETTVTPNTGQRLVKSLADLFPDLQGQTIESGYLHLSAATGYTFTAYEIINVGHDNAYFNALNRSDASPTVTIPFALSSGDYQTRLVVTDGTAAVKAQAPIGVVNARVTAFNADGSLLSGPGIANPTVVTFPVSGQYSSFVRDLFNLSSGQTFAGYLKVEVAGGSSTSGVFASAMVVNTARSQLTAEPGQFQPLPNLTITPAWIDPAVTTAVALVNPNNAAVTASFNLIRGDGSVQKSRALTIPPLAQSILVMSTLFPDLGPESDGYFSVNASLPIYGMSAFDDGTFLAFGAPIALRNNFIVTPNPINLATPVDSTVPANASTYPLTIQIPYPAAAGGFTVNLQLLNSTIASLQSTTAIIPEGQTTTSVPVIGNISGATVLYVRAPGFNTSSVVVTVQDTTDFTLARNVTLSPQNQTIYSGQSLQFTASYDTTNIPAVTWQVAGINSGQNAVGTIDQNGLYAAPLLVPADQPITVEISVANVNTTYFGAATLVTILPPPAQ